MQNLASEVYEEVLRAVGTVSGSNGDGLSRTWSCLVQYGPFTRPSAKSKLLFDP